MFCQRVHDELVLLRLEDFLVVFRGAVCSHSPIEGYCYYYWDVNNYVLVPVKLIVVTMKEDF